MRRTPILAVLVGVVVALVAIPGFVKLDKPNSDGLFYEVQRLEVEGHSEAEATRTVFDGAIARQTAHIEDDPGHVRRVLDPHWVEYSKRFYRRRWLVPAVAAAVAPIVGEHPGRALRWASLLGYLLIAPVLFLLLRRRFPALLSAALAVACTLAPPVYKWSLGMRVDSWGLLLEALGLLAAVLWLVIVEWRSRAARRVNLALLGSGIAAALPAFVLGGTPVRDQLAYVITGYKIPEDTSWSFIGAHYMDQLWRTIRSDFSYPTDFPLPVTVILYAGLAVAVVALVAVMLRRARGDPYFSLAKAAIPGCFVLLLLANNAQAFRLELIFVPIAAIGLAIIAMRVPVTARVATLA